MSKTNKIQLSIKGGGLSYKSVIDADTAAKIMTLCLAGEQPEAITSTTSKGQGAGQSVAVKGIKDSPAEYLDRFGPKRNPDKILTLAGYIQEVEGRNSFNPGEIKRLFRDAGEVLPANFGRDFRWTKNSGWIAPDLAKKGNFYITNTGRKVLQGGFPDELVKKSKNKATGRRKKSRSKK